VDATELSYQSAGLGRQALQPWFTLSGATPGREPGLRFDRRVGELRRNNPGTSFLAGQVEPESITVSASFVWDLRNMRSQTHPRRWRLSGIITMQAGRPFTIGATNNPMAAGSRGTAWKATGADPGRPKGKLAKYFDTRGLQIPANN
jgi:hypothetical protein